MASSAVDAAYVANKTNRARNAQSGVDCYLLFVIGLRTSLYSNIKKLVLWARIPYFTLLRQMNKKRDEIPLKPLTKIPQLILIQLGLNYCQTASHTEAIMNQQEYIDVSDRVRVSNALRILEDIIPEQSSVITPSELQHVLSALRYWEKKLLEQIGII